MLKMSVIDAPLTIPPSLRQTPPRTTEAPTRSHTCWRSQKAPLKVRQASVSSSATRRVQLFHLILLFTSKIIFWDKYKDEKNYLNYAAFSSIKL